MQIVITRVLRVDRNRGVAQHGFRTGSGDHYVTLAINSRITDVPKMAVFLSGDDFQIGESGMQYRVPVHQPFAPVNQILMVKLDKNLGHRT